MLGPHSISRARQVLREVLRPAVVVCCIAGYFIVFGFWSIAKTEAFGVKTVEDIGVFHVAKNEEVRSAIKHVPRLLNGHLSGQPHRNAVCGGVWSVNDFATSDRGILKIWFGGKFISYVKTEPHFFNHRGSPTDVCELTSGPWRRDDGSGVFALIHGAEIREGTRFWIKIGTFAADKGFDRPSKMQALPRSDTNGNHSEGSYSTRETQIQKIPPILFALIWLGIAALGMSGMFFLHLWGWGLIERGAYLLGAGAFTVGLLCGAGCFFWPLMIVWWAM